MKTCKQKYRNCKTGMVCEFDVECDQTGHVPFYWHFAGDEWKAVTNYTVDVVKSEEFFESAHEFRIKCTKPPLDASGFGYGIT